MDQYREIERKFIIGLDKMSRFGIFESISKMPYMDITQGYLPSNDRQWVRLRQILYTMYDKRVVGEEYTWTIKGSGSVDRPERETAIWKQQFHVMWPLFEDISLHKHRYSLSSSGAKVLHLDIYKNGDSGIVTAEVEFDTLEQCDAYVPEEWFGLEVSKDPEWSNYSLALKRVQTLRKNRQQ